jgi:uncharacterized protein with HEPN domain
MAGRSGGDRPERDAAYVQDILDSCSAIVAYTRGMDLGTFTASALVQDAVARRLFVIGESAKSLSDLFRARHPQIDWRNIGRLRDKLGHHYWAIELDKIWDIVVNHLPALSQRLERDPILGSK